MVPWGLVAGWSFDLPVSNKLLELLLFPLLRLISPHTGCLALLSRLLRALELCLVVQTHSLGTDTLPCLPECFVFLKRGSYLVLMLNESWLLLLLFVIIFVLLCLTK